MALLTEDYKYPLINKFRDVFSHEFRYAAAEGLTLTEKVTRRTNDEIYVDFIVSNWTKTTPNTWCGVAFGETMIDTIRGSRETYSCVFRHNDGETTHTYTVQCTSTPLSTPIVIEIPDPPTPESDEGGDTDMKP